MRSVCWCPSHGYGRIGCRINSLLQNYGSIPVLLQHLDCASTLPCGPAGRTTLWEDSRPFLQEALPEWKGRLIHVSVYGWTGLSGSSHEAVLCYWAQPYALVVEYHQAALHCPLKYVLYVHALCCLTLAILAGSCQECSLRMPSTLRFVKAARRPHRYVSMKSMLRAITSLIGLWVLLCGLHVVLLLIKSTVGAPAGARENRCKHEQKWKKHTVTLHGVPCERERGKQHYKLRKEAWPRILRFGNRTIRSPFKHLRIT